MGAPRLTILQVSTYERRGGAEQVAMNLLDAYRRAGHRSYLVAGRGPASDPDVVALSRDGRRGARHAAAGVGRLVDRFLGLETYRYPASRDLPAFIPHRPDIVHAHNLHGGYFDLRVLPDLSREYPLVLTLHDSWLLTGHCSHSLSCERWRTGCGTCPDLTIYPAVRRDATAQNWNRKRDIFARSRLCVATPSAWLMERVRLSMLAPAVAEGRVIPNGIDLATFAAGDMAAARASLGLPPASTVILFAGGGRLRSGFKDFAGARAAVLAASQAVNTPLVLVALGEEGETDRSGDVEIRYLPAAESSADMASFYRAADVYLHAARVDTFPTAVLEALACGTPVVASAVGGIPEQVKSFVSCAGQAAEGRYDVAEATGALVRAGDTPDMARALVELIARRELRESLGANAARDARRRFDLDRQRDAYLAWYYELLAQRAATRPTDRSSPVHAGRGLP